MTEKKHHKEEKSVEKMTIKELREIALEIPHEHTEVAVRDMNKEQLIIFIKQARGVRDEESAGSEKKKKNKVKKVKVVLTKQDVKARIRKLKEEKAAVNDRKNASILRRRISRLKKLSRRAA
jgi:hypothetical protein